MASLVDLHAHTTASDGALRPRRLVALAKQTGLRVLAVTDHDTLDGLAEASASASRARIELVPGTELTAYFSGHEVHLLAYYVRSSDVLARELALFRERRVARMKEMIRRLAARGVVIPESDVLRPGMGAVGRPHLARSLVQHGYAENVPDAFERFIGSHCPAHVRKYRLSLARALRLVREAGGISVLAHPGRSKVGALVGDLKDSGLRGIEAYHSSHDATTTRHYLGVARRLHLLVTGGSDFHGGKLKPGVTLGCVRVPMRVFVELRKAADA